MIIHLSAPVYSLTTSTGGLVLSQEKDELFNRAYRALVSEFPNEGAHFKECLAMVGHEDWAEIAGGRDTPAYRWMTQNLSKPEPESEDDYW